MSNDGQSFNLDQLQSLLKKKDKRLEAMHEASKVLLSLLGHTKNELQLMQQGIEALAILLQARYGAISILDSSGEQAHFLHTGIDEALVKRIGHPPQGLGLLGIVVKENQVIRLDDMQQDARSIGFPEHHPLMKTILAAPISMNNKTYGRVYLCDKLDGELFSNDDEKFITTFANTLALVNFNLHISRRRKQIEKDLRLAKKAMEHTQEGVMMIDSRHIIRSVNRSFTSITGYSKQQVIGQSMEMLAVNIVGEKFLYDSLWCALESNGHWKGELNQRRSNGEVFPVWAVFDSVGSAGGESEQYVCVFRDITEEKKETQRIEYLAHHDPLTKLPNRTLFEDRLEQLFLSAKRYEKCFALMFIDLDLFKIVNDTMGHNIGDFLLREVANRMSSCIRSCDTISRVGGDEFTVLLSNINDCSDAGMIAQKILVSLSIPFCVNNHEIRISASIGIAMYPEHGRTYEELLKCADAAMYHSKESGNIYNFYSEVLGQEVNAQLEREEQLYSALERCELSVAYQPKIDINSLHIVGVKVLLRWHNSLLGFVQPSDFIPLAEQTGLIVPIGKWMLNHVFEQCLVWKEKGLPIASVTIPLSSRQFYDPDLLDMVSQALAASRLSAEFIEFEITKKTAILEVDKASRQLDDLKKRGIRVIVENSIEEIDQLGSHSAISADALKINATELQDITGAEKTLSSAESLIAKAHNLKIRIVAEGVENVDQLLFLRACQCDEILGNFFSRPIGAVEFEQLLIKDQRANSSFVREN
ncbi:MAG TPA: diguanylate cyclase [Gammaproteobacteria bacterium]|nr:diguanylate cyclase [Gammaproteobacteria bacterium]